METKTVMKAMLALLAAIAGSAMAETRTWRGGSGKWSVPGNWEENAAPQNGDSVVFASCADVITVTNDIPNLELAKVTLAAGTYSSAIVLTGEKLKLTGTMPVWDASCLFTNEMPLVVAHISNPGGNPNIKSTVGGIVFQSDIEALGTFNCSVPANTSVEFNCSITGENAMIYPCGSHYYRFHKPINVKGVIGSDYWVNQFYEFYAAGNTWTTNDLSYGCQFDAKTANAFPTNMVMRWKECRANNNEDANYRFSADQTIDRIESAPIATNSVGAIPTGNKFRIVDIGYTSKPTLTLRATASASCYAIFAVQGTLSLVYDPVGDYTQTFVDRAHAINGKLTVRGGTLESRGNNTFASVKELEIHSGARFKVSANESGVAVNPFSGGVTEAVVACGGVLEVCGGVTLTLKN